MMNDAEFQARLDKLITHIRDFNQNMDPIGSINAFAKGTRSLYGKHAMISVSLRTLDAGCYRVMRLMHQEGVASPGLTDIVYAGEDTPAACGGLIGEIIKEQQPIIQRDLECPEDPVLGVQLAPYRFMLAYPVYGRGKKAENWMLFLSTDPDAMSHSDIESRLLQTNLMSGITNNKIANQELRKAHEWIQREIDEVANIQRGLLPEELPEIPGILLGAMYQTYDRAGGDYYDVFEIPPCPGTSDKRWLFFIADASGHGPSAAVIVAMLSALLHAYPGTYCCPAQVLDHCNSNLLARKRNTNFVTAFLAFYTPATGEFLYSGAGHPMPLLRQPDGAVSSLYPTEGFPLGLFEPGGYTHKSLRLHSGEALLLYTDGLSEARSPQGEFFTDHRLHETFGRLDPGDPAVLMAQLEGELRAHEGGTQPSDDQSALALAIL